MSNLAQSLLQESKELSTGSDVLSGLWLDLSLDIKEPEPIIKQGDVNMCTLGNFSCITGQAKSRKTFLISGIVGAFFHPDEYMGMSGTTDTGTVLYIDTEQSVPHVQRVIRRIHRIAGWNERESNDRLKVLCLRELAPSERKEAVKVAMEKVKPTLCVLDGVADLMEDTNSNLESVSIATLLLKLTSQYNCHILTALHTNPNSDKARGHIGSEITRKAETVLNVSKDGNVSLVKAAYCRDIDIQDFAFMVNEKGLPELVEMQTPQPAKVEKLHELFSEIIPLSNSISYTDLTKKVMEKSGVRVSMAKRKISDAAKSGIVVVNEVGFYHLKQKENEENELPF